MRGLTGLSTTLSAVLFVSSLAAASAFSAPALGALPSSRKSAYSSALTGAAQPSLAVGGLARSSRAEITGLRMGKQAAFGPFTPAVIAVRSVVGEKKFNQIRGKGITLHSQVITEFCVYAGVPRELRQGLIRLAKTNGNTLGFLS